MGSEIKLRHINYFYILLIIIWIPLQSSVLNIDGKGRIPFFFTIIVLVLNLISDKNISKKILTRPILYWLLWIIYSSLNSVSKGYYTDDESPILFFIVLDLFSPFLIMVLAAKEYKRDNFTFLRFAILVFIIFGLLDLLFFSGDGTVVESTGRTGSQLGNTSPLNMIFLFFIVCLLYVADQMNFFVAIILSVFSFSSIFISSTRKALGAAMIMFLFSILSQMRLTPKSIVIFVISSLCIILSFNFILNNTEIGKRIIETQDQAAEYYMPNNKFLTFLGDRAIQYVWAWELFNENPLTGIGLSNFIKQSNSEYMLHSEYMVQLSECGIIGTIFFCLFLFWFWKALYKRWKWHPIERSTIWVLAGGLLAIMFIQFTSWTYSSPQYFLVYGIILGKLNKSYYENWNTHRHC